MHNLYTKRDVQRLSSLSPFSVVGFSFPWHAGGNVWVCGGSVEKCWYTWRLQLQLTCTLNIFFFFLVSRCKLWKAAGHSDFVFTIIHNGQIGLPQWFPFFFSSPCWIHCHQPNCCFPLLPLTSINPFYICFDRLLFLHEVWICQWLYCELINC